MFHISYINEPGRLAIFKSVNTVIRLTRLCVIFFYHIMKAQQLINKTGVEMLSTTF